MSNKSRADIVIQQIENGDWELVYNRFTSSYLTATKDGCSVWISFRPSLYQVPMMDVETGDRVSVFGIFHGLRVWFAFLKQEKRIGDKRIKLFVKTIVGDDSE